jgi:heme oxygenase (mycobilin-producing)
MRGPLQTYDMAGTRREFIVIVGALAASLECRALSGRPMKTSFINLLKVPAAQEDRFLKLWERGAEYMSQQPGFVWTTLHRNLAPNAAYQYFTIACWENAEAFQRATATEWWQRFVAEYGFRDPGSGLVASPAICQVVSDRQRAFEA